MSDNVIIRSKINMTEITDEELSNINTQTISEIIDKETINYKRHLQYMLLIMAVTPCCQLLDWEKCRHLEMIV